ncbi:MAG: TRAP transporter permease [Burkholderiales bacterium]
MLESNTSTALVGRSKVARAAEITLAALVTLSAVAWCVGLHTRLGFTLFPEQFYAFSYGIGIALLFVRFPAREGAERSHVPWYDVLMAIAAIAAGIYVAIHFPRLTAQSSGMPIDGLITSIVFIVTTLEGTRRAVGLTLVIIVALIAAYVLVGHLVPGPMRLHKADASTIVLYLGLDTNALLGIMLEIATTVVVAFVLMGQLLARSGGAGFFNDIAIALMGRFRGGAAKIAVLGSSLFGMISGIAVANAVAVGIVTIPLMIKSGMPRRLAAAVEACASNGGQLMPPVMGAVAFVMADFLQIPYREVAIAAIIPSVLYYAALFIQSDLEAARYGFGKVPKEEIPKVGPVLMRGWIWMSPFAILVIAMFWWNWEPEVSALLACVSIIVLGFTLGYGGKRMSVKDIGTSIFESGVSICEILVVCGAGGFILGLFQVSGLAFAFSSYLVQLGGENLLLLLVLCAVVNILLGMGLPTLGVYVMLAILVAPALVKVGVPALAAHMFILYFGMMSLITPPVATAASVAATIAGAPQLATGWTAMRFGWTAYIVPFLFVYSPAMLMRGTWLEIVTVMTTCLAGVWFVSSAMTGYFVRVLPGPIRACFVLGGVLLLLPYQGADWIIWANVAGALIGAVAFTVELKANRLANAIA